MVRIAISLPPPSNPESPRRAFGTQFKSRLWQATQIALDIVARAIFTIGPEQLCRIRASLERRHARRRLVTRSRSRKRILRLISVKDTA